MDTGFIEFANEAHEIRGISEVALGPIIVRLIERRVTAQGEDVCDAGLRVTLEDELDFGLGMADTGEMRDGRDRGGLLDPDDEVVGEFAGGSAGTVGDGNERRLERLHVLNSEVEFLPCRLLAGWKEFERERWAWLAKNVADVHEGRSQYW